MKRIGIFFGSDTGNTERVAKRIQSIFGKENSDLFDVVDARMQHMTRYEVLILGISTWYYGEPQCDWNDFFPVLKKINFSRKTVAIFGCGDQKNYPENFCDAMGRLYEIVNVGKPTIIGFSSIMGYSFKKSQALINSKTFLGLVIDEDNQSENTDERIQQWVKQLMICLKRLKIPWNFSERSSNRIIKRRRHSIA